MRKQLFLRAVGVAATATMLVAAVSAIGAHAVIDPATDFSATPGVPCVDNSLAETTQGRTPLADYQSGRAKDGYMCNASQVSHLGEITGINGSVGGYRVYRYTDATGKVCGFYDTTLLFPVNAYAAGTGLTGVWVLDMTDPAHPVHTATLSAPSMQSPHESFSMNVPRGLLGAVFANPVAYNGQFDLYSIKDDCTHPVLKSSTPTGILGHEGSFAPDGMHYYAASLYGHTFTAIDTTILEAPVTVWTSLKWNVHGLNLSDDGNTLYFADVARNNGPTEQFGTDTKGLTVLDVSQIQAGTLNNPNPQVTLVKHISWPHVGTPQTALPIHVAGHEYLVEVDEFGGQDNVGAARIINVDDRADPKVVSNIRLAVNNKENQTSASQQADPNATNSLSGYRGHYCQVPSRDNPHIVACSFILSGLRVFDITDLQHPKEIAYFNKPSMGNSAQGISAGGAYAMSQPAFDMDAKQIWYSDGNTGFYVVQIDPSVWPA